MNIIELTRQLGKELQASEEYKNLIVAREANDNDAELQDLIGKFNLKRIELNSLMSKEEKDQEAIAACNTELQSVYQIVMANPNMVAFNAAKTGLDSIMNQVNTILVKSINGEDPETCAAVEDSCSGSCSTCGGCH